MPIRTYDDLAAHLASEFKWRTDEITAMSLAILNAGTAGERQAMLRGALALLYAHWEGFIRDGAEVYLEFVHYQLRQRRHLVSELSLPFLGLAMAEMCPTDPSQRRWFVCAQLADFLQASASERAVIPRDGIVDTESNLKYAVLERILRTLGLEVAPYELKRQIIDHSLLKARNEVAHGEYLYVESIDYDNMRDQIVPLLQLFKDQVLNAAAQQAHCA